MEKPNNSNLKNISKEDYRKKRNIPNFVSPSRLPVPRKPEEFRLSTEKRRQIFSKLSSDSENLANPKPLKNFRSPSPPNHLNLSAVSHKSDVKSVKSEMIPMNENSRISNEIEEKKSAIFSNIINRNPRSREDSRESGRGEMYDRLCQALENVNNTNQRINEELQTLKGQGKEKSKLRTFNPIEESPKFENSFSKERSISRTNDPEIQIMYLQNENRRLKLLLENQKKEYDLSYAERVKSLNDEFDDGIRVLKENSLRYKELYNNLRDEFERYKTSQSLKRSSALPDFETKELRKQMEEKTREVTLLKARIHQLESGKDERHSIYSKKNIQDTLLEQNSVKELREIRVKLIKAEDDLRRANSEIERLRRDSSNNLISRNSREPELEVKIKSLETENNHLRKRNYELQISKPNYEINNKPFHYEIPKPAASHSESAKIITLENSIRSLEGEIQALRNEIKILRERVEKVEMENLNLKETKGNFAKPDYGYRKIDNFSFNDRIPPPSHELNAFPHKNHSMGFRDLNSTLKKVSFQLLSNQTLSFIVLNLRNSQR